MSELESARSDTDSATKSDIEGVSSEWAVDGLTVPQVVSPASFSEVSDAVRSARDSGSAIIPWGGGTMMGLGNTPPAADIALDLTEFDQVVSYEPDDLTIAVQTGCRIGDLNRLLGEQGQMLPFDAALPDEATIGGLYCTAVSGPRRFGYGSMRDLVIGITTMSPDGEISRGGGMVVKNVSGYDMMRLHYGALGSLGIVLQLNFKVLPAPRAVRTVVMRFENLIDAVNAAMTVRASPLSPTAMMVLNERAAAGAGVGSSPWTALLRADGPAISVEQQAKRLIDVAAGRDFDHEVIADELSATVWQGGNRALAARPSQSSLRVRLGVAPSSAEQVVAELTSMGSSQSISPAISADFGNGLIFAEFERANDDSTDLRAIWEHAQTLGQHATMLTGPADVKHDTDVFGGQPAGFHLMQSLKRQFDPTGTLNRGRFIGRL